MADQPSSVKKYLAESETGQRLGITHKDITIERVGNETEREVTVKLPGGDTWVTYLNDLSLPHPDLLDRFENENPA